MLVELKYLIARLRDASKNYMAVDCFVSHKLLQNNVQTLEYYLQRNKRIP